MSTFEDHKISDSALKESRMTLIKDQDQKIDSPSLSQTHRNQFMKALNDQDQTPSIPLCRQEEAKQIENFIIQGIRMNGCSHSLYVAGTPGIGKTLTVTTVIEGLRKNPKYKSQFRSYYINALKFSDPRKIYKALLSKIFNIKNVSKSHEIAQIDYMFSSSEETKARVMVIDQLDYLITKDESVLYNLFEWTQHSNSKLILVTIANTFNLPQTLNPRTCSRIGSHRVFFKGYTRDQIYMILQQKLKKRNIFSKQALKYACAKIVSFSCDIRRATHLLKVSLDKFLQLPSDQQVSIQHVKKAFNQRIRDKPVSLYIRSMPKLHKFALIQIALASQDKDSKSKCNVDSIVETVMGFDAELEFDEVVRSIVNLEEARLIEFKQKCVGYKNTYWIELIVTVRDVKEVLGEEEEFRELVEKIEV